MDEKQAAGQIGELHVFSELLKRGVGVYKPLVDDGLDALARLSNGETIELQIKSAAGAGGTYTRWFSVREFDPRPNFFIVCVTCVVGNIEEVWVFPSMVFDKFSTGRGKKQKALALDLAGGKKKYGEPLGEYLRGFKSRWELIANFSEFRRFMESPEGYLDLEDIVTSLESFEQSEEEKTPWEEYVLSIPRTISD